MTHKVRKQNDQRDLVALVVAVDIGYSPQPITVPPYCNCNSTHYTLSKDSLYESYSLEAVAKVNTSIGLRLVEPQF